MPRMVPSGIRSLEQACEDLVPHQEGEGVQGQV